MTEIIDDLLGLRKTTQNEIYDHWALLRCHLLQSGRTSFVHHARSRGAPLKRNVENFKYLNLWQHFPLRFLAWHSPTCWSLFPAPSLVPEIKMTAVFPPRGSFLQRPFSDSSLRRRYLHRGVEKHKKSCRNQPRGRSGGLYAERRKKDGVESRWWRRSRNILNRIQQQSLSQVHFSIWSVWLRLGLTSTPTEGEMWLECAFAQTD